MAKRPYVAICYPSAGHPHPDFQDSIERVMFDCLKNGIDVIKRRRKGAIVEHNRNLLVNEILTGHADVTHIMFVDDDMIYPPATVRELLKADKDLVICQGYHKKPPYTPMACVLSPEGALVPVHINPIDAMKEGPVRPVSTGGGGTMLVRRRVFEKIPFPWFLVQYDRIENVPPEIVGLMEQTTMQGHVLIGEDTWFFSQAHTAGFKVYCHFGLSIGHIYPDQEITWRDYERYCDERNKGDDSSKS